MDKTKYFSFYFDFDSKRVTNTTESQLTDLLSGLIIDDIDKIKIVGYTDFIGSNIYNKRLSLGRAESIVDYVQEHLYKVPIEYIGRGVFDIPERERVRVDETIKCISPNILKYENMTIENKLKIKNLLKPYRRVEIVIKNKYNYNK